MTRATAWDSLVRLMLESLQNRRTCRRAVHVSVLEDNRQGVPVAVDVQALGRQGGHGAEVLGAPDVQGQLAVGLCPGNTRAR